MVSFLKWLSTPYYFNPSKKFKLKASILLGLLVFAFLYIFRPFSISSLDESLILNYTLVISLVSFISSLYMFFIPPLLFKDFFNEDQWTIGRNLLFIFISILCIGTILWLFANFYRTNNQVSQISYLTFLTYTFLTGSLPVLFLVLLNEKNVRLKRIKRAKEITIIPKTKEKKKSQKEIRIYAENNKEFLNVVVDQLVYITSQGNYASFFFQKDDDLKEEVLRVTLNKVTRELETFDSIIRCHKSYIINKDFIDHVSGNARGYLLHSKLIPFQIPVSRSFSKESLEKIAK